MCTHAVSVKAAPEDDCLITCAKSLIWSTIRSRLQVSVGSVNGRAGEGETSADEGVDGEAVGVTDDSGVGLLSSLSTVSCPGDEVCLTESTCCSGELEEDASGVWIADRLALLGLRLPRPVAVR